MFRLILGLVALTVSEWSALSYFVAVTFLNLRSTLLSSTPDISIPGIIIILIIIIIIIISVRGTTIYCSEWYQVVPARLSHKGRPQTRSGLGSQEGTNDGKLTVEYAAKETSGEFGVILCVGGLQHNGILCVGGLQHNDILSTVGRLRFGETFDVRSGDGCAIVMNCNAHFELQLSIRSRTEENHGKP
jgi:hypothetical protein